jgi:hypothetical protein
VPRRAHVAVAAGMAVLAAAGVLVGFSDASHRMSGTNSAGARVGGDLPPKQELCIRRLWLPARSASVSLLLATRGPVPVRVHLRLRTPSGSERSAAVVRSRVEDDVEFPIRPRPRGVPATICLRAVETLIEVGSAFTEPYVGANYSPRASKLGQRPEVTLDGRPLPAVVAVRFRESSERSALGALGDAAERAAVLRPGFVGPWTYPVLAVLIFVLWLAGLSSLWRSQR